MSHCYKLRLHGIRGHQESFSYEDEGGSQDPHENIKARLPSASHSGRVNSATARSNDNIWRRRHCAVAAKKDQDWADVYLSTAATNTNIAGFLTEKETSAEGVDAEYFLTFIPKAVINQDPVYKELLAIFNSLNYWAGRGLLKDKKMLMAIADLDTAELIKKAKVKTKEIGPQKVMILKRIQDLCRRNDIEFRVPELTTEPEDTIIYALVNSAQPHFKAIFRNFLSQQTQLSGSAFVAKERLFPPSYV